MAKRPAPIARIALARSVPRLLLPSILLSLAGVAAIVAGLLAVGGAVGIVLAVLGGVLVAGATVGAVVLLSVRVEVEESAVGLLWLGGERIYPLTPGPVTRVRLRGEDASKLRARTGALGWGLGRARLRDEEEIEVVRLAATRTAILVPTERGRLAIGAADEEQLLAALSRAARARQRLEAIADQAAVTAPPVVSAEAPEDAAAATDAVAPAEPTPIPLTGIERARLEQRLAQERAAALASEAQAGAVVDAPEPEPDPAAGLPRPEPRPTVGQPRSRRRLGRPTLARRPRPSVVLVVLPLLAAGIAYGVGFVTGSVPPPGSDLGRLTWLALVLAGPATSIGALMALAWWPRIVGVVVAGGLAASLFIGRALLG